MALHHHLTDRRRCKALAPSGILIGKSFPQACGKSGSQMVDDSLVFRIARLRSDSGSPLLAVLTG
jgi:hypothetical protein